MFDGHLVSSRCNCLNVSAGVLPSQSLVRPVQKVKNLCDWTLVSASTAPVTAGQCGRSRSGTCSPYPVVSMTSAAWIQEHVAAFAFFGGVPARLV